jgi:hypothetical protein
LTAHACFRWTTSRLPLWISAALLSTLLPVCVHAQEFVNTASEAGIEFSHQNGATSDKYMPETMGGGGIFLDYDADGWIDIFLVNGGSFVDLSIASEATHRLYHNNGDGTFADRSAESGIEVSGFGMGACSADYDNDGQVDLYVTSMGANRFYRNQGDGHFADITEKTGTGYELWSSSCAFGDVDNDGDVDLYVTNYVDFTADNNKPCMHTGNVRVYCHPNVYNGMSDLLYRNDGNGTFTDVSHESGIYNTNGKGLGVVFADYDRDGWTDIHVANDSVPNFMFHNSGDGTFEEVALFVGVAVNRNGEALAGMGTDMGDLNGDGLPDAFVTNLSTQTHSLYTNLGAGLFMDSTFESGAGRATLPFVGFGTTFFDFDNDGDLDIGIANGDVIDNVGVLGDSFTYPQRNLLLENDGDGMFVDVGPDAGPGFALEKVGRALASADIDNDGDLDLLIVNVGQTADVLQNDGGNANNSILIRTVGSESNRDGIGAELTLSVNGSELVRHVKAGSSYLAQSDLRVHFGFGTATSAERLEIRWPSGQIDEFENIDANQILTIREGEGILDQSPFPGRLVR